jgi:Fur family ferric uptake transcriptional regulator
MGSTPVERDTSQRRAIRKVLQDAGRPLSPHEVLTKAQGIVPRLGIATVYRTVKGLTDQGVLVAVELPGEPQRYEVAGKVHHHHFSCRACGRVFELEGCPGNLTKLVPKGFVMEDHELFLYGRCKDCK